MGNEVKGVCRLHDLLEKVACDLLVKKTNYSQHFKDEVAFAFLAKISIHKVTMVDEMNNLSRLNAILHQENIGQQGPLMPQFNPTFQTLIGEDSIRRLKDS
jgi:hypothetical protein